VPRFIAFLRAINVGGHTVTMAALRKEFEALGLTDVETFIASGNVIFTSRSTDLASLENTVEARLRVALGYEVATFIRTGAAVATIAAHKPFTEAQRRDAGALCVGFLSEPLGAAAKRTLMAFTTDIDNFQTQGREVYWICKTKQSDSTFSNAKFEKAVKARATFRGINTVVRLAAKYSSS
jgi:uncharacterized protein (DUF1697 family)